MHESVAPYLLGEDPLVTDLPQITSGYVNPPSGPGLGTRLQPGVLNRADATVRRSDAP